MWTENCQMFKLDLETAEAAEIKLPTSSGYQRSKRVPENHLLLLYLLHQNLWLCASQQTVEHSSRDRNTRPPYLSPEKYVCRSWSNRHETTDWFQIGKGVSQSCILSSFLFNLNAEYIMWNARLDEAQTGIKIVCRWHHSNCRKQRGTKKPLEESEWGGWKSWLKTQRSENEDHGIQSHHFMTNRWGNSGNSDRHCFLGLQNRCRDGDFSHDIKRHLVLGRKAMTNLDRILKRRDYFANKGPSSQGYAFSSSHVWMWELDY